jgi:alpha-beta hydrolase superfamily lysophospholipase
VSLIELKVPKLREQFEGPHYLIKTSDGKTLFLRAWEPLVSSKIAVLIFHGITGYSGFYDTIGVPVSKAGYTVLGLDLRGHGLSDGKRGDYPNKQRLLKDISETISFIKAKFPVLILLGHSLGNLVALEALQQQIQDINGVIFMSIGKFIKPGAYPPLSFGQKLKTLFKIIFAYGKPVMKYYREGMVGLNDPLFNFQYTPRFLNILNANRFIKKFKFTETYKFPVLVCIADGDEIFPIEAARAFYDEILCANKEFHVILNAKHAEYPEGSWKQLIAWLDKNYK